MLERPDVPDVMIVSVTTASDPFEAGDVLSIAFNEADVGRLEPHERRSPSQAHRTGASLVPSVMTVRVLTDATPYSCGATLTLSFTDPRFARLHPASPAIDRKSEVGVPWSDRGERRVRLAIHWTFDRARRFVNVIDKLFTIDRLGAYRHVLAMRLLVPDEIVAGDASVTAELARALEALRCAVGETLGRPLLAAFMPEFAVEHEWIASIDTAIVERAARDLRMAICAHTAGGDAAHAEAPAATASTSVSAISARDFDGGRDATGAETIALLIPSASLDSALSETLRAYRSALGRAFARPPNVERAPADLPPNVTRALDESLWKLVGTVGATFGGVAAE